MINDAREAGIQLAAMRITALASLELFHRERNNSKRSLYFVWQRPLDRFLRAFSVSGNAQRANTSITRSNNEQADMITIAERMVDTKGRSSGFDFMRITLSLAVMTIHSVIICYGLDANSSLYTGSLGPTVRLVLPVFFALSGFLVAGSLLRSKTLGYFLGLRIIRLFPALIVEVLLSAFLIGPLLSDLPLFRYFSDTLFFKYLWNLVGHVQFNLPGVFASNPLPNTVNGSLWTVPFELYCYIGLTLVALTNVKAHRSMLPAASIGCVLVYIAFRLLKYGSDFPRLQTALPGPLLLATFLAGVSLYFYRGRLKWSFMWFVILLISSLFLLSEYVPYGEYVSPFPIAYVTVWLGLTNAPRPAAIRHADYSYGVYLYGYVIQQTVVWLFPLTREWYWNTLISIPLAIVFASLSWKFVEKPALNFRHVLERGEQRYLETSRNFFGRTKRGQL